MRTFPLLIELSDKILNQILSRRPAHVFIILRSFCVICVRIYVEFDTFLSLFVYLSRAFEIYFFLLGCGKSWRDSSECVWKCFNFSSFYHEGGNVSGNRGNVRTLKEWKIGYLDRKWLRKGKFQAALQTWDRNREFSEKRVEIVKVSN